jgi:hypothetical protein
VRFKVGNEVFGLRILKIWVGDEEGRLGFCYEEEEDE